MARPRKETRRDASDQVIKTWFERSMTARDEQRAASSIIAGQNCEMQADGVDPGVLSVMRRIAGMPEGKRGLHLFLVRRYADVLEEELHDPAFEAPAEAEARPFAPARTATAA